MLLSKKEKEKLVVKLANERKTTRDIAKTVHISSRTIGKILNKVTGDDKEEEKQRRLKDLVKRIDLFNRYIWGLHSQKL
ncbi:MAG: helix-turn-helix domain-containing protein [Nitrosopumilus sp.]|nr:helix-turn-helix domain-containing protein [Nitrosopumilus sp.]